jgi:hypothetical protein
MRKIPVGDTISKAYGFAFSNFFSIFGIAWLPYVTVGIIAVGLVFLVAPDLPRELMQGDFDSFAMLRVARIFSLLVVLLFIAGCMVIVGIQRKALGRHPGHVFVYFSLGAPVWRMAAAFFLAWLVIVFVGAVTAAVTVAVWFAVWRLDSPYLEIVRGLALLVAACWFIYMCVRLTFLLPAVVVAEGRIGLGRAWELGGGNFWRMLAVMIAVFVPAAIAFGILESAFFGVSLVMPWHLRPEMDVQELGRMILRQYGTLSLLAIIFEVIERIFFIGLGNGMIASAYLALVQPAPDAAREP